MKYLSKQIKWEEIRAIGFDLDVESLSGWIGISTFDLEVADIRVCECDAHIYTFRLFPLSHPPEIGWLALRGLVR